ncbi:MAG TPA: zf-HC2 domain-containing protein [Gemmatimonadales bacterium]|jgi:anti-sigma factor RsiW|nr:zf-HC2 domain-containing protein [Gemmatimonadales bacterium]
MTDIWTDRLSEYLDGELPDADRSALEDHLRHCIACGAAVADLKRIVRRARALDDRAPAHDLWPGIAARIGAPAAVPDGPAEIRLAGRIPRRWVFSLPQLAAAGIALMTLSGAAAWLLHPGAPPLAVAPQPAPAPAVPVAVGPARPAERSYDVAVAELQQVLTRNRGRLDTTTVRIIEQNLATIDRAIAQAQRALAADSANIYLNSHLAETMRRKLELLRQAAALVSAAS